MIGLVTIENCILGLGLGSLNEVFPDLTMSAEADVACMGIIALLWFLSQAWTTFVWFRRMRGRKGHPGFSATRWRAADKSATTWKGQTARREVGV